MTEALTAHARSRFRRWSRPLAAVVFVLALVSLADELGWVEVFGDANHSRANAAVSLALAALGILAWKPKGSRVRRAFVIGCGLAVAVIASATLYEWFSGTDLGIDSLLVPSHGGLPFDVRMAPTTAVCLLLAGLVVATLDVTRPRVAAVAMSAAAAIFFIVALAVIGLLYGVGPSLGPARYTTRMALASAVALSLLSFALQCARPGLGLVGLVTERGPTGLLARWLLVPAMVAPVAIGWLTRQAELAGDLGDALGDALTAIAHVAIFVFLTVLSARAVRRQDRARLSAENGLRVAHDALEARVLERTSDLSRTNDELVRAREEAVHAMRARSDFLARMSHEIRTPLNGVLGMIALTRDTELTDEQDQLLATADASAQQLLGLVEDILDFAKIDAGKLRLDHVPFQPEETIATAIRGLAHGAHAKEIELLVVIDPSVPEVLVGDPKRLQQVIVNLVANAIRFTDVGEVVLSVKVAERTGEQVVLEGRVCDTGIGIAPDKQKLIFEAFMQSEVGTTRKYGGTGLGLAICSELVHLMEGTISVESDLGEGSTFIFTGRFAVPPATLAAASENPFAGLRFLVVDAHATSRRVLGDIVRQLGAEPTLATPGDDLASLIAASQADARPFALVLLDLAAGVPAGILSPRSDAPPVIGIAREPVRNAQSDGAFAAVVAKPVLPLALREVVLGAIQGERTPTTGGRLRPVARTVAPRDVLVVEDNATNARVVTVALERIGHRPVTVSSGRQALTWLARGRVDIVLMDVQMLEMDGLEATRTIRAGEARSGGHVPIVGLTAQALAGDAERCTAAGMDAYLAKPIDLTRLAALIDALTASVRLPAVARREVPVAPPAEAPIFARAELVERVGGDEAMADEIAAMLLAELPAMRATLQRHVAAGELVAAGLAAHALRGALLNVAAEASARAAQALEDACRASADAGPTRAAAALRELEHQLNLLAHALGGAADPMASHAVTTNSAPASAPTGGL